MIKSLFRVVKCGEPFTIKSEKSESGQVRKRYIHLQEIGGKYSDQYVATLLGKDAICDFYPDDLIAASLRAQVSEYNEKMYQDILELVFEFIPFFLLSAFPESLFGSFARSFSSHSPLCSLKEQTKYLEKTPHEKAE